ncbi:MAG TPA: pilus assembly protein TadG-related protein [Terracidiphilus sp.]|nr:pilus assembly protein TadG-related protein [Terracidiphilus sp.]
MRTAGRLWQIVNDECGQALMLGAICMAMLMAGMAVAVDVGYMHYRQVQLQTAADAAAIAAGLEIGNCNKSVCSTMETAAEQALIEDGITSATVTPATNQCSVSSSTGLAMIINVAPCVLGTSDPNNGNTNMTEVVLTEPQSTFFGKLFGIPVFNLMARAEAGEAYYLNTGGGYCIYAKSIEYNSNSNINLTNCGIYDSGNLQTNTNDSATASTFLYYGSWSPNNCNKTCTWTLGGGQTQPTHTNTAQKDPLAGMTPPTQPAISTTNTQTPSNGETLQPGYYPNGFNVNSNQTINLSPGLYYMGGSIVLDSNTSMTCTGCTGGLGVTLYFASGSFQPNSNSTVQLTAATAGNTSNGDIANMLLWAGPNAQSMTLDSNTGSYFKGIVYLPNQTLTLNSNSLYNNDAQALALDVDNLIIDSNSELEITSSGGYLGGSGQTLGSFALAE